MSNDIDIIKTLKRNFINEIMSYGVQYDTTLKISAALEKAIESLATPSPANGAATEHSKFGSPALQAMIVAHANGAVGEMPELPEPLEIYWPTLNSNALGCGVEDRGLHDRYECAEYGWQDGVDRAVSCVPDAIYDADQMQAYAHAAVLAEREQMAAMCDALKEQRFASGNVREGSAARTLAEMIRART